MNAHAPSFYAHADEQARKRAIIAEIKRATLQITGHTRAGSFEGYASVFGLPDLGGDIVVRGAFRDSLAQRGARGIKLLWQHDSSEPLGVWTSIAEDARGLHVKGQLNLDVGRAREIHALMREGAVDGLSIGFRTDRSATDTKTGIRSLQKIDLWEISVVTFPMLPQARVSAVKRGSFDPDGFVQPGAIGGDIRRAMPVFSSSRG